MKARQPGPDGLVSGPHGWIEAGHILGEGVRLVFTNRLGGTSEPPFHSMNLSMKVGDDPGRVAENRRRLAQYLEREPGEFAFLEQVHGTDIVRLGPEKNLNPGARERLSTSGYAYPGVDGAVTLRPGPVLCVLTADCAPLALYHPRGAGALLHAGWMGTHSDIAGRGVRSLCELVDGDPGEIRGVIGPCIGPCCYRVDEERARLFADLYGEGSGVIRESPEGCFLDLRIANLINLERAGVRPGNLVVLDTCTSCRKEYFSHRREGKTGRQGAFLLLY